jgi:hypothetical protein
VPEPSPIPIHRAPMRARDRDLRPGVGADQALERGLTGTGDGLDRPPETLDEALAAVADRHGDRAARRLRRFADVPDGAFVWTRGSDDHYRLGRLAGPWRYDDDPRARAVGIHHVRPTDWLDRAFAEDEVPPAVAQTFGRGGRNFQRTHDAEAERATAGIWAAHRADR